jgi:2'-hydroxyisoflavone reductase
LKLLVLGGTRFLGRHVVDVALARGHAVTIFTRGNLPSPFGAPVNAMTGDRDPRNPPALAALAGGEWDAVIDTSGYVPRIVRASAELLARRVHRYLFVSSLSVYAHPDRPGLTESASVATLDDPDTEDVLANYGAPKAACEAVVRETFGASATIVRPGLIVGPHDSTDRFGYWVARFIAPELLGDRPSHVVVPAPSRRPIQLIDARDLASWLVLLLERDLGGTFNAASPRGTWTMGDLIDALVEASPAPPAPSWIAEETLTAAGVEPWIGLPLWLPAAERDSAGFLEFDCERARAAGLATRPLARTISDTAAYLASRGNASAWRHVLSADRERAILGIRSGGS